ncbi:Os11g0654200 [Oryza sativa Japonica Group]|uniref:Os11g0654200 protein n=1 Tax=Oryza sativa subsp. japonica TaxID=39947 RepID=A0A0P0Y586_ORYSJ|nr:Os11g0654200 [Oryza sativa Japonica Group]
MPSRNKIFLRQRDVRAGSSSVSHPTVASFSDRAPPSTIVSVQLQTKGKNEAAEVDGAEYDEQPVEAVEPPVIEVINELAAVSAMAGEGDLVHDDDEQRAEEQADGAHAQEQTRVHGLHPFGVWILAEEDVEEHVGEP